MAETKLINTRIKNKVATFSEWHESTGKLLDGEIAIVRVPTGETYTNPVTGKSEPVVELLMKVGDGVNTFDSLPWLSAKASDVYDWAKRGTIEEVPVTIGEKNSTIGAYLAQVDANTANIADHETKITTLIGTADEAGSVANSIKAAIEKLASTNSTNSTGSFVTAITQANGVVDVTYGDLPEAVDGNTKKGIVALGVSGGAATYDSIYGTDGINAKVEQNTSDIASLQTSIAGGVHFIGITTSNVEDKATINPVTVDGKNHTASAGDVVIKDEKEFIWDGAKWKELGDLGRVATLEGWRDGLGYTGGGFGEHKFVTKVTQYDGKIAVTYAQPAADDISYGTDTVATALGAHQTEVDKLSDITTGKVGATIDSKISDKLATLVSLGSMGTGYVANVTQTNGIITVTKENFPEADVNNKKGIVTLSSATNSISETAAATPKAVKAAYDKADNAAQTASGVATNYIKVENTGDNTGKFINIDNGVEFEIIFDCGGAPIV